MPSLILWATSDGKDNIKQDCAKFLDRACILFSTSITINEKFTCMDMKFCSVGEVPKLFIIGTTRSRMQRYALSISPEDRYWECVDFIELDTPNINFQSIAFSGTGAMSASVDNSSGEFCHFRNNVTLLPVYNVLNVECDTICSK